jgi:hypothetical protein
VNFSSTLERSKSENERLVYKYRSIRPKSDEEKKPRFGLGFFSTNEDDETHPSYFDDNFYDMEKTDGLMNKFLVLKGPAYEMDSKDLKDEEYVLLPGYIYAYTLRSRKFC